MSKNLQHSKETTKSFNIKKQAITFNLFKSKDKNFQHPKAKRKAFNIFKNKNKNLQPLKAKTKACKHKRMKIIDALGQIC
jgi:hypothetical protein